MKTPPLKKRRINRVFLCDAFCAVAIALPSADVTLAEENGYLGPSAVAASKDGRTLFVAHADARQLAWVAPADGTVTRRLALPGVPTGMAVAADGTKLFVSCASPKSVVLVLDPVSGACLATLEAGHTAMRPAISPDGTRLYVPNRFDNDVSVIEPASGRLVARWPAVREPIAVAVTPDGRALVVANHLPNARTDPFSAGPIGSVVTIVDTRSGSATHIQLPSGANSLRDVCVSPDGRYAYVTHLLANFLRMPTQLDMGWVNLNAVSVIDVREKKLANTVGLDDLFLGAGNPWGIACTADGKSLVVAQAGTHEVTVIDRSLMLESLPQMFASPFVGALVETLTEEPGPWRRIKLPGKGPRGLAVVGANVYVAQYFDDSLAVVDLDADAAGRTATIALGPEPELTIARRGELLFNDATICYQRWQSCASCHPEGRSDALNWDLLNDGAGNSKNTKSMLLAHRTPPSMAEGVRETAEVAVRAGITHILFTQRPEEDAAAMDAYLKSLRPVPSPRLIDGRLSPAAERGKKLFESDRAGCYQCHPAPLYTDRTMHNLGPRRPFDYTDKLDTPTLVEVWRTGPYLHDGRYMKIEELFVDGKHGESHGDVDELTAVEIAELVEFVLSL